MTADEPKPETTSQARLANSHSYVLTAAKTGERFRIDVAVPFGHTGDSRLPVVYVLDGNAMFAMAAQTVRLLQLAQELPPLLVVGVGYDIDDQTTVLAKRMHDLTPVAGRAPDQTTSVGGGAGAFRAFIDDELKPFVAARFAVDADDATLVGDSLGGLFALHTLFTSPTSFRRYVAGSPSLWWADRHAFGDEEAHAARATDLAARLFVAVGALEEDPTIDRLKPFAMVSNLARLVETLQGRRYPSLRLDSVVFPDETHVSVIPATLSRGLRRVFAND
jgi:uncharacterized protein